MAVGELALAVGELALEVGELALEVGGDRVGIVRARVEVLKSRRPQYPQAFRCGMPPHGGFTLGLARRVAMVAGAGRTRGDAVPARPEAPHAVAGAELAVTAIIRHEMETVTVAERPDLTEPAWRLTRDVLPEYNNHGDVLNRYWGRLTEDRPEFQFHLVGDSDEIRARARSIPVRWDGSIDDLPAGIDGAIARGFDEGGANVPRALVIMIPLGLQGRGLSAIAVRAMLELARRNGLTALIAPVRPSGRSVTRSCRSSATRPGGASTDSSSTPGCASTSGSARSS